MIPKLSPEDFISTIKTDFEYYNKGKKLLKGTRIPILKIQYFLGANSKEMYRILNCPSEKIRLRTNLEEEFAFHLRRRLTVPYSDDLPEDIFIDFYRDFDEVFDDSKDQENFPRCLKNLSVRYEELCRFATENPDFFVPLGDHYDFSRLKFYVMPIRICAVSADFDFDAMLASQRSS